MSVTIITNDVGPFGLDWDPDTQVLSLSDRLRDNVVRLGGDPDADPAEFITWIMANDTDVAHAIGVDPVSFRDHLRRVFIEPAP